MSIFSSTPYIPARLRPALEVVLINWYREHPEDIKVRDTVVAVLEMAKVIEQHRDQKLDLSDVIRLAKGFKCEKGNARVRP